MPGGKLDGPEDPEECAQRELIEEIWLRAGELVGLGSILTTPGFTDERIWLYLARDLEPVGSGPTLKENEVIELERILCPMRWPGRSVATSSTPRRWSRCSEPPCCSTSDHRQPVVVVGHGRYSARLE